MIAFSAENKKGIFLPDLSYWLDPRSGRERAFVSHAHSDHFARHGETLCSLPTRKLIETRYTRRKSGSFVSPAFGETIVRNGHHVRLHPAGHVLGSAQIHITRESDGASLLYTGDFKWTQGLTAEKPETEHAQTLVMETTFGLACYRFPPREATLMSVVRFARKALEDGCIPVLLGYSLGKAQEILAAFQGTGLRFLLHDAVYRLTRVYSQFLPENTFPEYARFEPDLIGRKSVLIFPPHTTRSRAFQAIARRRTAMLTGWALDEGSRYRYQVDEVFPLSDHADYDELLEFVRHVNPQRVFTTHGYAAEFARDLRSLGIEAWTLAGSDQLDLPLEFPQTS